MGVEFGLNATSTKAGVPGSGGFDSAQPPGFPFLLAVETFAIPLQLEIVFLVRWV